jgi:TolB-like protein
VASGLRPLRARPAGRTVLGLRTSYVYTALAALLAIALGLNVGGVRDRLLGRSAPPPHIKLAVLPFLNLTGDPEQEYLSDGITQEMITQLGRLHPEGLSVIARSSVMRYKDGATPVDQIGRELGVEYVLEGSARLEANRVRITAELIHVLDQTQLWGDSYERELSGILAVQSEVALNVARALALRLLPAEQARLASVQTVDPEAYQAYLKALHYTQKLTAVDLDIAQRYLERALERDPSYASAYAGLAIVWVGRQQMSITPPPEAGPKAKAAALQAIALDDGSADAHEALAVIKTWVDWDWASAETEFRRALEINPNQAGAHAMYSHYLAIVGRPQEALAHSRRAIELDPYNAQFHAFHAGVLVFNRRYDDAMAAAQAALAIQPGHTVARSAFERGLIGKGLGEEHVAFSRESIGDNPELLELADRALAEGGYEGYWRALADYEAERYVMHGGGMHARSIAQRYLSAGDYDLAIEWLWKSYEERNPNLTYLGFPHFDPLRDHPRFQELVRRMNLPADPGR